MLLCMENQYINGKAADHEEGRKAAEIGRVSSLPSILKAENQLYSALGIVQIMFVQGENSCSVL